MGSRAGAGGRDTGLAWGVIAAGCVGTVLTVWSARPEASDGAPFDYAGSLVVLASAVVTSVVGAVVSRLPVDLSRRWRRVAWPTGLAAIGVAVLVVRPLLAPRHGVDFMLGLVLLVGAVATAGVAVTVGRRRRALAG
jgi:drug/metabolite transporter (DMT)-like permease